MHASILLFLYDGMLLPMFGVISIDIVTALCAVVPMLLVTIPQPQHGDTPAAISMRYLLHDVREGLAYVKARSGLVIILGMAMVINFLFNPASMLTPLLVKNHFMGGAWELSMIESAMGIGVIIGSLALSAWGGFKKQVVTSMTGLIGMGLGALITGLTPGTAFAVAITGMLVTGIMNPITNGPFMALLQTTVDPSYQGRVMTLGTLLAAPVADLLGIPAVVHLEEDMRLVQPIPEPVLVEAP